jgi:hypothetical protein
VVSLRRFTILISAAAAVLALSATAAPGAIARPVQPPAAARPAQLAVAARPGQARVTSRPAALVVSWGRALEVPGTPALNVTGQAQVNAVSCPAAGSCAAAGFVSDASGHNEAFVTAERKGAWGKAGRISGLAKLDAGGQDYVDALSCAQPGYCSAAGSYIDGAAHVQSFVAGQSKGAWGAARPVPGLGKLNTGGQSAVNAISCPVRGTCAAGGFYKDGAGHFQALLLTESKGRWANAAEARGTAALNSGGGAAIYSVTCMSAGNCTAGGYYTASLARREPFVISETRGHWGSAVRIGGIGALNAGGDAEISSLACTAAGSCTAGGYFAPASNQQAPMLVVETKGKWGNAKPVTGAAKLNTGHHSELLAVSCARNQDCSATGYVQTSSGGEAFVVGQTRGHWGSVRTIPGLARLNKRGFAEASTLSCTGKGDCSTAGFYFDASNHQQVFVATELNGRWGNAIEVPGSAALNKGADADFYQIACASPGNCSAGGFYKDGAGHIQAFLVNETARLRKR